MKPNQCYVTTFALFSLPFGRATNYWQNHQGAVVRLQAEAKHFPFSKTSRAKPRGHKSPVKWKPKALSSGVKRPVNEPDY